MPYGLNIATCHACGNQFTCGDCILSTCAACEKKGHEQYTWGLDCPQCKKEDAEMRMRVATSLKQRGSELFSFFVLNILGVVELHLDGAVYYLSDEQAENMAKSLVNSVRPKTKVGYMGDVNGAGCDPDVP